MFYPYVLVRDQTDLSEYKGFFDRATRLSFAAPGILLVRFSVERNDLPGLLECLVRCNKRFLSEYKPMMHFEDLGIRFAKDPKGIDLHLPAWAMLALRCGDCEDWCALGKARDEMIGKNVSFSIERLPEEPGEPRDNHLTLRVDGMSRDYAKDAIIRETRVPRGD